MEDIIKICFQLCLVLFSVLLGWAIYNVLDQYPCLHRFGRIWDRNKKGEIKDRRIMLCCWVSFIVIVIGCVYSLSQTHELFKEFSIHYNNSGFLLYIILGLFSFIYFFIPYLINRFLWSFAIVVAPTDCNAYAGDPEKKHWLTNRFSEETISTLCKRPTFCGTVIAANTGVLLALLILSPCIVLRFWGALVKSPQCTLAILGVIVIISLIGYYPYSRHVQ